MAMLAEPRRKVKFGSDPRGTAWSKDENKVGQKLMEKMGWSKGKGLGANEDGKTEHIAVSLKFDTKGVGCSKSHADNWIAHQDDFNDLLSTLNQNHATDGIDGEEKKVLSLEETSRKSRGRVHYQKFTKGKDLSRRSANDLDCVLGKRKSRPGTDTPQEQSETNSETSDTEEQKPEGGLNTYTSTDSVHDYFAKKMAEKKAKLSGLNTETGSNEVDIKMEPDLAEEDTTKMEKRKKKKKEKKRKLEEENEEPSKKIKVEETAAESEDERVSFFIGGEDETAEAGTTNLSTEKKTSKKKKKKRSKVDITEAIEEDLSDVQLNRESGQTDMIEEAVDSANVDCGQVEKKKSKKNKKNTVVKELSDRMNDDNVDGKEVNSSSKKNEMNATANSDASDKKKKKKRKNKDKGKNVNLPSLTSNKDNLVLNKSKLSKDEVEKYGSMISKTLKNASDKVNIQGGKKGRHGGFKGANVNRVEGYANMVD